MAVNHAKEADITAAELRVLVAYDRKTGFFTNRFGRRVGNVDRTGYRRIKIFGKYYAEHRLVWLYVYGAWPSLYIDHINGNRADNRLVNLRQATTQQNSFNRGPTVGRSAKGITRAGSKWQAQIMLNGKNIYIGRFSTPEEAAAAYAEQAKLLHGDFGRSL